MTASLGLTAETVFALSAFGGSGGNGSLRNWHKHVARQLGERLPVVEQLIAEKPPVPRLLWLLGSPEVCCLPADSDLRHVRTVVSDFSHVSVEPYWKQIHGRLELECELRARVAITNGFDGLVSTLHPAVSWKFPVLEIRGTAAGDIYLGGNGVLLSPSLFLPGKQCVIIDAEKFSGVPAIVFPASQAGLGELSPASTPSISQFALGALIGHSRAAALEALAEGCTTGELSRRLGLSLAGASKHATVLRRAGLITTFRHRNTALHVTTPLGLALLRGDEAENHTYQEG